jgi:hypothetical protein
MKLGAFFGLGAAALLGAAITHDNIHGVALLLYPAGLVMGLVVAHTTAAGRIRRGDGSTPTPEEYYRASKE